MTRRNKELDLQRDYEQKLREVETKRPQGCDYIIKAENGAVVGSIVYNPMDDTLAITVTGEQGIKCPTGSLVLKGGYIASVNKALTDLLSEPNEAVASQ